MSNMDDENFDDLLKIFKTFKFRRGKNLSGKHLHLQIEGWLLNDLKYTYLLESNDYLNLRRKRLNKRFK